MDKDKLDKTKDNIGVSKLDESTRKKLFEKFVEGGGRVIVERSRGRRLTIDRQKQKEFLKRVAAQSNKRVRKERPRQEPPRRTAEKTASRRDTGYLGLFFRRLSLRIKLKVLGITGFNGYTFNGRFFRKFNSLYRAALMELQILYLDMFRKNLTVGKSITEKLDEMKPLYYELIEMTGNLFDKIEADQVVEQYINFPEVPKKTIELKEQILSYYKKLFILSQYENSILTAYDRAISLYEKIEEKPSQSRSAMARRMRNAVFVLFHKFFPRLHLLFCLYEGIPRPAYDPDIETILGITEMEKPGNRQLARYFDDMTVDEEVPAAEEKPEEEKDEVDGTRMKVLRIGLEMMAALDMSKMRLNHDRQRLFENVSDADKVFVTYLLFNEFDREYSFILTTNKIKFRTDFVARTKVDFRSRLTELYDKMRKSTDILGEYAENLIDYEKSRREKPSSSSQYIEYTKRMEALEKKKNTIGKNALAVVRDYMMEIVQELEVLLEDMDSHQLYIENPQEVLTFDTLIEGEKKINGKKIYEALYLVYCYAFAFAYRLSLGGDLSGDLEFKKEELEQMRQQSEEAAAEDSEKKQDKSVLEELDDML
ncbi:MAG: hypothetical protein JXA07_03450 [Spirochaetes bacterium]|nr:hypothetical protein [Spirochaetota bacterium]